MKTVKDYLDLGLVFVDGDMIRGAHELINIFDQRLNTRTNMDKKAEIASGINAMKIWSLASFAWRNNGGVAPEYSGEIEVLLNSGHKRKAFVNDLIWIREFGSSIAKWRPVVLQSESPKEDKPMKPVYTAEMHAKKELPPVDSKVTVCIEEAGFELEGNDPKHEGKVVTVKAAFVNKDGEKLVAIENDKGNCACYIIECIKPIIKTIKVNGFDVPAPMSEAPEHRQMVYLAHAAHVDFNLDFTWQDDDASVSWLSRGLVHSTKSAAIAHAKAMLGIDPNA